MNEVEKQVKNDRLKYILLTVVAVVIILAAGIFTFVFVNKQNGGLYAPKDGKYRPANANSILDPCIVFYKTYGEYMASEGALSSWMSAGKYRVEGNEIRLYYDGDVIARFRMITDDEIEVTYVKSSDHISTWLKTGDKFYYSTGSGSGTSN